MKITIEAPTWPKVDRYLARKGWAKRILDSGVTIRHNGPDIHTLGDRIIRIEEALPATVAVYAISCYENRDYIEVYRDIITEA